MSGQDALDAFRAPAMSRADLELNIRGSILDALVETSAATGIVAGESAELLLAEVYKTLFVKRRRWTMELALRLAEDEVLDLQASLRDAQEALDGPVPEEFPEVRP